MDSSKITHTIDVLRDAAANPPTDVEERRNLYKAARQLMLSAETFHETTQRLYYGNVALPLVIVGIDLDLFKTLSASPGKKYSIAELAQMTNSEELLLQRITRGLLSHGFLDQDEDGLLFANEKTKLLADDGVVGGAKHNHLHVNPALQMLPEFLQKTKYRNPSDSSNLAFQMGHNTTQTTFEWLSHRPEDLKYTMAFMATQRGAQKDWMSDPELFPAKDFELQSAELSPERVLMVDVGGGSGHQCMAFRRAHPELKGRIILQDLPGTVEMADQEALKKLNIEPLGHDFMTEQPIKGAKVYYMRNILHDWPDATCLTILKHLRAAMGADSVIIIDEIVVRNTESLWKQVNYDIVMMSALGGMERTKEQWKKLLSEANLELREIVGYDNEKGDSIIIATPAF